MSNQWLSVLLAAGVILGGADRLLGNRFGLGQRFEEALHLLGPTVLSMAGILCLCPLLTSFFEASLAPIFQRLGLDPAILGGILAIDMGGYQLAVSLAQLPAVGLFSGITVASTFGCTFGFTIPVGCGMLSADEQESFLQGILMGLPSLAVSLLTGGLLAGLTRVQLLSACFPFMLLCVGFWALSFKKAALLIHLLQRFAQLLQAAATVGLVLGAVGLLTPCNFIPALAPLKEAIDICAEICITLLGSLPLAELLRKALCAFLKPAQKSLITTDAVCAVLFVNVSVLSALTLLPKLSKSEQRLVAACAVCGASVLPHLGFLFAVAPEHIWILLLSKLSGLLCAVLFTAIHFFFNRTQS